MNDLVADVILENINPKKWEAQFPSGKGLVYGETIEECISSAKEFYEKDNEFRVVKLELRRNKKFYSLSLDTDIINVSEKG